MCRILEVSRNGFYDWRNRPASDRTTRRQELTAQIRQAHGQSRGL